MQLERSASIAVLAAPGVAGVSGTSHVSRAARFAAVAALAAATLVAIAALGGILAPATYARETPIWRTEGIGQDWASLVVDVPWLVGAASCVLRGSRRGRLLLASALVYTAYTYAVYALDVHFNALFLIYCGALGTSAYALVAIALELRDAATRFDARAPRRFAGGLAMACALGFALLWLAQIVPALRHGVAPADVDAAGLMTNPVHVLDLALVLPAMFAGGWLLWTGRALGYAVVPVLLGFLILMSVALAAMMAALAFAHLAPGLPLVVGFLAFGALGVVALAWMFHAVSAGSPPPPGERP